MSKGTTAGTRSAGDAEHRDRDVSRSADEDLLAVVAHELRAPLAVVCSAAETIAADHLADRHIGPMLDIIRRNAELALLLIDRLGLARDVEVGTLRLETVELDLAALASETVGDLAPSIGKDHQVRMIEHGPVRVVAGTTSLREILLNLLSNAVKYSPTGTEIEVTVIREGERALLTVRDQGRGIRPADAERVFDKYTQLDHTTSGVGLGLYLSRGLARANGGDLTVVAPPGGGSLFTLQLAAAPIAHLGSRDVP